MARELELLTVMAATFIVGLIVGMMIAPVIPGLNQNTPQALGTTTPTFTYRKAGKATFGRVEGDIANITSTFRQVNALAQKLATMLPLERFAELIPGDVLLILASATPLLKNIIAYTVKNGLVQVAPQTWDIQSELQSLIQTLATAPAATVATPIATLEIRSAKNPLYQLPLTYTAFYEQQLENVDEPDPVKYSELENTAYIVTEKGTIKLASFRPQSTIIGEINVLGDAERIAAKLAIVETSGANTRTLAKLAPRIRLEALHLVEDNLFAIVLLDYPYIPRTNLTDRTLVLVYNTKTGQLMDWFWVEGHYFDSRAYKDPSTGKAKLILVTTKYTWALSQPIRTSWGTIPSNATAILSPRPRTTTIVILYDASTRSKSAVAIVGDTPMLVYFEPHQGLYIVYETISLKLLKVAKEVLEELHSELKKRVDVKTIVAKITNFLLSRLPPKISILSMLKTGLVKVDVLQDMLVVKCYRELDGLPIRNQFSIDLYNNTLRIVLWRGWGGFNLYVLDPATLKQIANMTVELPGERVYGVRFIGPYLYVVTYRTVDPLFAISLANPEKPEILGWREGPGWDEFLYPLNETTILGIGYSGKRELRVSVYKLEKDGNIKLYSSIMIPRERASILFQGRYGYHALVVDKKRNWILVPGTIKFVKVTINGERQTIATLSYYLIKYDPITLSLSQPEEIRLSFTPDKWPLYRYARALVTNDIVHIITPYKVADYQIAGEKPSLIAETRLV